LKWTVFVGAALSFALKAKLSWEDDSTNGCNANDRDFPNVRMRQKLATAKESHLGVGFFKGHETSSSSRTVVPSPRNNRVMLNSLVHEKFSEGWETPLTGPAKNTIRDEIPSALSDA